MALKVVMQNDRDFTELSPLYLTQRIFDLILRVLECIVTISLGVYLVLWLF